MTNVIRFFLKLFTPVQKLFQNIKLPDSSINWSHVREMVNLVKPGDVLLSYEKFHLTSWFIKGKWDHAAIFFKDENHSQILDSYCVIEATGKGVHKVNYLEWCFNKDHIMILRKKNMLERARIEAAQWAADQVGKQYDYEFSKEKDKYYCSELCADALDVKIDDIIYPNDFVYMTDEFEIIYSTRK